MSELLRPRGKKTNHQKGIAAAGRARKREEAEIRQARYAAIPLERRVDVGHKERRKIWTKLNAGQVAP